MLSTHFQIRLRMLAVVLLATGVGAIGSEARAQGKSKPIAVVSFAPLSKMMPNISYLTRSAGFPEANGIISMFVNGYTGGIDRKQPWGLYVYLDDNDTPATVAYLPVQDRESFFTPLAAVATIEDLGDNRFSVSGIPQTLSGVSKGSWTFIAQDESHLENLPEDPTKIAGNLSERYDLSVRLDVQNIPPNLRDLVLNQMRDGFEGSLAQQAQGKSESEKAEMRELGEQSIRQIEQLVKETDQLVIGWAVDSAKKQTYIDMGSQFVAGSELEKQVVAQSKAMTSFGAFQAPNASASMRFTSPITPEDAKRILPSLKASWANATKEMKKRSKPEDEAFHAFFESLLPQLEATIQGGILDGGMVANLENGLDVVTGGRIGDGARLAADFKKLMDSAPKEGAPQIKFDAYKHKDVVFHLGSLNLPASAPETARNILGSSVRFVIGTAPTAAYLAIGNDCEARLKSVLDASTPKQATAPMDFHVEMQPVLNLANKIDPKPQLQAALDKLQDDDSIQVTSQMVPRGMIYRIALQEGVLRAIGAAAKSAQGRQ